MHAECSTKEMLGENNTQFGCLQISPYLDLRISSSNLLALALSWHLSKYRVLVRQAVLFAAEKESVSPTIKMATQDANVKMASEDQLAVSVGIVTCIVWP